MVDLWWKLPTHTKQIQVLQALCSPKLGLANYQCMRQRSMFATIAPM